MKEWIWGRNPVFEVLRTRRRKAYQLRVARGVKIDGKMADIFRLAEERSLPIQNVPRETLDGVSRQNQGVILQVDEYPYADLDAILKLAEEREEPG